MANDFTFIFAGNYLLKFYTDVFGVSPFVVGILFVAARFVDAVSARGCAAWRCRCFSSTR